jgi:NTE family protein
MKRLGFVLILLVSVLAGINAQGVGLVLSGGGAKGVAHIGLIQALEDNGIPIDYVTGTSIGAVVGGLYSMGYSPAEMMELIKSKDFENWKNGTVESKYVDFFRRPDPTPDILSTSISLKDSAIDARKLLPSSLLNPIQLNIAFMQLTAQSTAYCKGDFNKLFIPYRSVASNIQDRSAYVFRRGDLGEAIRASMTFPLVFKAIRVDNKLLYDGGIYNNYPVDIMRHDFKPEVMIGCVVDNAEHPKDYDMYGQIQRMIMHPTNDSIGAGAGVQLKFDLDEIGLLAFEKADSVYKIGYDGALGVMDSIKRLVSRRIDPFSVELKRALFKSRLPAMRFKQIEINGVTELQREYILKVLKQDGEHYFSLEEFKVGYFKILTSSKIIKEIVPHAVYVEADQAFKLILDVEANNTLDVSIGVNLSSALSNQLYLGLSYELLNEVSQVYKGSLYLGRFHTGLGLSSQFNFVGSGLPKYIALQFSALKFNYYQDEKLFYQSDLPAFVTQYESFLKVKFGIPYRKDGKFELATGGAFMMDSYMQEKSSVFSKDSYDKSNYFIASVSGKIERNSLNGRQFNTVGFRRYLIGQYIIGLERYRYPNLTGGGNKPFESLSYFQLKAGYEQYIPLKPKFIMGFKSDLVYNTKRHLDNYTSTVIQAPGFTPTPHSLTVFNEAYRSNQFLAAGVIPIWKIKPALQWRTELHGFAPLKSIHKGVDNSVVDARSIKDLQFLVETSLVYNLTFANASVFVNRYSSPSNNWNIGFNFGFLLFPKRFLE